MSVKSQITEIIDDLFDLADGAASRIGDAVLARSQSGKSIEDILVDIIGKEVRQSPSGRLAAYRIALALEMIERPVPLLRKRLPVPA